MLNETKSTQKIDPQFSVAAMQLVEQRRAGLLAGSQASYEATVRRLEREAERIALSLGPVIPAKTR